MQDAPSKAVLIAFRCTDPPTRLAGGQGGTWRSSAVVLKPMYDPDGAIWEAETLSKLPQLGYRIAEPVCTSGGDWTCEGWTASRFVDGICPKGSDLTERLAASRALHADLVSIERPAHFDRATDPWAIADEVAFGFADWSPDDRIASCLERFRRLQSPIIGHWQVIHGDLAGNFLLSPGQAPAIIDFTPKWSPRGFGEAVFGVDVCLWENIPLEIVVSALLPIERRLLPLAASRRLLEIDTLHKMRSLSADIFDQVSAYAGLADGLESLH